MFLFSRIINKSGLGELFKIIPNLKSQILKLVFFSILISTLDLLSLSLIGIFIISLLSGSFENIIPSTIMVDFSFYEKLFYFSFFIIFIYFIKAIASYGILKKIIFFCFKEQTNLRKRYLELYFSNFETLRGEKFENKISSVIEYIRKITESYLTYSLRLISDTLILIVIFIFLLLKNFELTMLLVLVTSFSFFIYAKFYRGKIFSIGKFTNETYKKIIDKSLFIFGAFKEIKIANKEKEFTDDFLKVSQNYTDAVKNFSLLTNLPRYYAEFIFVVFILVVCITTLIIFGINDTAYSIIGVYSAATARLAPLLNSLTQSFSIVWNNRDSAIKIADFIDLKNDVIENHKNFIEIKKDKNILKRNIQKIIIENFSFSYEERKIYENVNLELKQNHLIGVYGSSGSGKTTFINSIIGFLKPKNGKILFKGINEEIYDEHPHNFINYIPQEIRLMSESILKNVSFELNDDKIDLSKVYQALEISNSLEFVNKLKDGVNTILHSNGQNLSGGQKQRLAIARALYNESQILILDEPFSSLDEKSENYLLSLLKKIKNNKIVIIITHKKSISKHFDEILMVDEKNFDIKKTNTLD